MFSSRFRDFDWMLLSLVLVLSVLSVLEIRSATAMTKFHGFQTKQIIFLLCGIVLMFLMSLVDYHRLLDIGSWAYGASIVLLVAVLIPHVGQKVLGGAAQDQPRRRCPFPAFRVGQAGAHHRDGPALMAACGRGQRIELGGHRQGFSAGDRADGPGA